MSAVGKSIRLFLVEGSPTGMLTAEVANWTGHLLVAPRNKLPDVLKRVEAARTGIYFLIGDLVDLSQKRKVYIGERDNVGRRVLQHSRDDDKEFFEVICLVTSKDLNLTKAHGRYLEARLTAVAKEVGRFHVVNSNEPAYGILPEADTADMERFLSELRVVLPVLGFDLLREVSVSEIRPQLTSLEEAVVDEPFTTELELELVAKKGMRANAVERDGEIIVRKGSLADAVTSFTSNVYAGLRTRLIADGVLIPSPDPKFFVFTRDEPFPSPSAASAVIFNRNDNGRISWKVKGRNQTLKAYQDEQSAEAVL